MVEVEVEAEAVAVAQPQPSFHSLALRRPLDGKAAPVNGALQETVAADRLVRRSLAEVDDPGENGEFRRALLRQQRPADCQPQDDVGRP